MSSLFIGFIRHSARLFPTGNHPKTLGTATRGHRSCARPCHRQTSPSPAIVRHRSAHDWPGNVRELENAIERAMTLCEGGIIQAGDLPPSLLAIVKTNSPSADASAAMTLPAVPESALYPLHSGLEPGAAPEGGQAGTEEVLPLKTYLLKQEQAH